MDRGNGQRRECKYRNLTTQRRGNLLPAIAPPPPVAPPPVAPPPVAPHVYLCTRYSEKSPIVEHSIGGHIQCTANWPFLEFHATFHRNSKIELDRNNTTFHNCTVFAKREELLISIGFGREKESGISFC